MMKKILTYLANSIQTIIWDGIKYSRMDQVKFVEDSLLKV